MERIKTYDIIRALCILAVVAYWHIKDYFFSDSCFFLPGAYLTTIALAGFTFISGSLNAEIKSVPFFYSRRLKRVYLPFALVFFLFCQIGLIHISFRQCLLGLGGSLILVCLANLLAGYNRLYHFFSFIATASFFAYLFHRIFYYYIIKILRLAMPPHNRAFNGNSYICGQLFITVILQSDFLKEVI